MKLLRNKNVRLGLGLILAIMACIGLFYLQHMQKDNVTEIEYAQSISLGESFYEPLSDYKENDPQDEIHNQIYNVDVFSRHSDEVRFPVVALQALSGELSDYLVSLGYTGQVLMMDEQSYMQRGTTISFNCSIGETGDTVYCSYSIKDSAFNFYVVTGDPNFIQE